MPEPDRPKPDHAEHAGDLDRAAEVFTAARPRLFGVAYRMLGSAAEAEDLVQDAWLRWQKTDRDAVLNPTAFLVTTVTRLAINTLQSARVRHEAYVGPWLPEPVDTSADPYLGAERAEALEFAALLLMEKLTANERAAYILREAFDYSYADIAEVLQSTEPAVRQLASRARKHMAGGRRAPVAAGALRELLDSFLTAARSGDMAALERLLAPDVVSVSDGNGRTGIARRPVAGAQRVARFLVGFPEAFWQGAEVVWTVANGCPAAVLRRDGVSVGMLLVAASDEGIEQLLWQFNPDKLGAVASSG